MPEAATAVADPAAASTATASDPNAHSGSQSTSIQTTAAESWANGWMKPDGSLDHKVFEKAPDDLKPLAKDFERFKTWDDFAKSYKAKNELLGKKGLIEPLSDKATDAEKADHLAMLRKVNGAPDKPEGYGLQRPQEIPEGLWNTDLAKTVSDLAFKHCASPALVQDLAKAQVEAYKKDAEAVKQQEAAWMEGQDKLIREAAGKEGLDYAKARELAERAGRRWGVDSKSDLMKNATAFMLLTRLGRLMKEDSFVTGDVSDIGAAGRMSADQSAKAAIDIMTNKSNADYAAYWNRDGKTSPERLKAVRDKVAALQVAGYANRPQRTAR